MSYKLTSIITNTGAGTRELTIEELEALTDGGTGAVGASLDPYEVMEIQGDLNNRYSVGSLNYFHSGSGVVRIYVSESLGLWFEVTGIAESWGTSASFSDYSPRWVKINHEVGSGSVDAYEVEFHSASGDILFGNEGQYSSYGLDLTGAFVQPIQIFNNTLLERDMNVFMNDSNSSDLDSFLYIGLTTSGTFYRKHENGLCFPDDFSWDSGYHSGTVTTVSGHLTLSGTLTEGVYYSPVFSLSSIEDSRFYWEYDTTVGHIDYESSVDSESCFGVRYSSTSPSGGWVDGSLAEDADYYWSTVSGVLEFKPINNHGILELREMGYLQFYVTLSGSPSPYIYKAGIEKPLVISGISPQSYGRVYIASSLGALSGSQTNLISWYKE